MTNEPLVVERLLNAPIDRVWSAITDKNQMKKWYFDIAEFKPEVGFEFRFTAGSERKKYLHLCKITEVVAGRKLTYSWRYDGYPGMSHVTFELTPEGNQTRVRLTHTGIESFPRDDRDFARESFTAGWTHIVGTALKGHVEGAAV